MIKLYHGSTLNIQRIDLTKSRPNKDFGQGFYLKTTEDMADFQVTDQEFSYQKEQLTAKMIQILVEEQGCDLDTAIDCVYSSDIYKKLSDRRTGLFFQSPRYVLSFLKEELTPKE